MRLCAIDYHLRTPDSQLCAQAKGLGINGLELTRSSLLTERRWLCHPDGPARWYASALAMGITIESVSAIFAYEWSPIDRHGRPDTTVIDAARDLVDTAAYLGAGIMHLPLLDAGHPKTYGELCRIVEHLGPILELRGNGISWSAWKLPGLPTWPRPLPNCIPAISASVTMWGTRWPSVATLRKKLQHWDRS